MPTKHRSFFNLIVLSLFALGAFLRLYDLTDQPIDFHPTRQLRGAIVARGMYYAMLPGADETLRQQAVSFRDSTGQYEPSILEALAAATYLAAGREIFWAARIYNTLFWLIGGWALLALARRIAAREGAPAFDAAVWTAALAALAYYLALPFGVQASRAFQPDPGMVMWIAVAAYALYRWSEAPRSWRWTLAAGLVCGMAILTKAVAIYIVGVAGLALALYAGSSHSTEADQGNVEDRLKRASGTAGATAAPSRPPLIAGLAGVVKMLLTPQLWVVGLLAVLPTFLYYFSRQARASEYFSSWTAALSHLLLTPRFYLGWANLVQELLNPAAVVLAILGIFAARGRGRALLIGLWLGYITYGLFLPYQMDTHSYYHIMLVWLVALSMTPVIAAGVHFLARRSPALRAAVAGVALALLVFSSWQALVPLYGQDYRGEPAYWQEIASYLPQDGKIIALTQDYGYRLMYYGWRKVTLWPNRGEIKLSNLRGSTKEFDAFFAKRTEGKRYFVITAFKQFDDQPVLKQTLDERYALIAQGQGYLIYDLGQPTP